MALISLTKGMSAIVDSDDVTLLSEYKWHALKQNNDCYRAARHSIKKEHGKDKRHIILMHRFILGIPYDSKVKVDHINQNPLDNRKCNLRVCDTIQNAQNGRKRLKTSSIYKGVSFHKLTGKYQSYITVNKKTLFLGIFKEEKQAAIAYNIAAKNNFKTFACLNII